MISKVPTGIGSRHAGRNLGALSASELGQLRELAQDAGRGDLTAAIDSMRLPEIEVPEQPAPPALSCPEEAAQFEDAPVNSDLHATEESTPEV